MAVLDGSIANVALPTISRELSATPAESIWVVNGFQIAVTATLFAFASLGELAGFTLIYRTGVAVFTFGSLFCALSHSLPELVVSRVLQGFGASMIMGIQPSMLRGIYPPQLLGRGTGWTALTVATSAAAGPTIGGSILAVAPWPWLFMINVPIGAVLLVMSARTIPHYPPTGSLRDYDLAGAIWCGVALSAFTLGVEAIAHGGAESLVATCFLAAITALVLFVKRERRASRPLIPLELFKLRTFTLSSATSVCSYTAQGLAIVSLPFFFQTVLGRTPFEAGLILTPWPLAVAAVAPFAGRLADRKPVWILATSGLAFMAAGCALLALLPPNPSVGEIVWREIVAGLGFGFFQSPNNRELLTSVPRERGGTAGGMLATARLFGQSLGAALVAVTFGALGAKLVEAGGTHVQAIAHATPLTLWLAALVASAGAFVSALRR
ncbi:MAG: MFS transporter [Candidatus Eremiobacteraeota bacterium]|nr:MFS transporter [Candidatus Eremiobacteraeota bacterium]